MSTSPEDIERQDSFPVVYSTLDAGALREVIGRAYAIEDPTHCQLLRRGLNDTYLLFARPGRFIARVYRAGWRTAGEISYELELLCHMEKRGVTVSTPVRSRHGSMLQELHAPEGVRHLVVFTYAEGTPLSWTDPRHSYEAGRLLADIHNAADDFSSPHPRTPLDLPALIEQPLVALRPFFAHRPGDWAYLEGFATRLRARVEHVARSGLDWGPCHGDYGAKNIQVSLDGRLTVFDFDLCGPGWRGIDLGLVAWVAMDSTKTQMWDAFVSGYTDTRPLSDVDLAATDLFHAIAHLWSLGVFAQNVGEWGVLDMSDWLLNRETTFFRAWEDGARDRSSGGAFLLEPGR